MNSSWKFFFATCAPHFPSAFPGGNQGGGLQGDRSYVYVCRGQMVLWKCTMPYPMGALWSSPNPLSEDNRGQTKLVQQEDRKPVQDQPQSWCQGTVWPLCHGSCIFIRVTLHHMCKHRAAAVSRHPWKSLVTHMLGLSILENMQSLSHFSSSRVKLTREGQCPTSAGRQHPCPCFNKGEHAVIPFLLQQSIPSSSQRAPFLLLTLKSSGRSLSHTSEFTTWTAMAQEKYPSLFAGQT